MTGSYRKDDKGLGFLAQQYHPKTRPYDSLAVLVTNI